MKKFLQFVCGLSVFLGFGHYPKYIENSHPESEDAHYVCKRCGKYLASAYF